MKACGFLTSLPANSSASVTSLTPQMPGSGIFMGNVGINNPAPSFPLVVGLGGTAPYCDGNTWVNRSDRTVKENFASVDRADVLARVVSLPMETWNYKARPGHKHIGPMAQDFRAAFGLNGLDDTHIATIDEGGVALAAIQGLNEKLESGKEKTESRVRQLEQRLEHKAKEITELRRTVTELKELVKAMDQKLNGGEK